MIGPLKIAPSDLTFLWDECQRCFYDKVRLGKPRPSGPFPSIFGKLDAAQKNFYAGGSSRRMYGDLPEGEVGYDDMTLESEAIGFDDVGASMFIRGRIDAAMRFNDGTFGIVDYKTSEPKRHHVEFYGRQLHAYMYAAEHPAMGDPVLKPISRMGLLCFIPHGMFEREDGSLALRVSKTWVGIPRDDAKFAAFLRNVASVLALDAPPASGPKCQTCRLSQRAADVV